MIQHNREASRSLSPARCGQRILLLEYLPRGASWQTRNLRGERQQLREELARLHELLHNMRRSADAGSNPAAAGAATQAVQAISVQAAIAAARNAERQAASERVAQAIADERAASRQCRCAHCNHPCAVSPPAAIATVCVCLTRASHWRASYTAMPGCTGTATPPR